MCFSLLQVQNGVDDDRVGANEKKNNDGCGKDVDDDDDISNRRIGEGESYGGLHVVQFVRHSYVQGDDDDSAGRDSFYKTSFFNQPCWTRAWKPTSQSKDPV